MPAGCASAGKYPSVEAAGTRARVCPLTAARGETVSAGGTTGPVWPALPARTTAVSPGDAIEYRVYHALRDNLDGVQFDPASIGDATGERRADGGGETVVISEKISGGRSRLLPRFAPLFVLFVLGGGYAGYRRFRGDNGDGGKPI